jgi:hypothetical protein
MDGDIVAWQRTNADQHGDQVVAYRFSTGKLIDIDSSPKRHRVAPKASHEHVAYEVKYEDVDSNSGGPYAALWSAETNNIQSLGLDLGFANTVRAFVWPWLLLHVLGSENRDNMGIWAMNLENGSRFQLYRPPSQETVTTRGYNESLNSIQLSGSNAYIAVVNRVPGEQGGDFILHEFNLETRGSKEIYRHPSLSMIRADGSKGWLIWEGSERFGDGRTQIWAYNQSRSETRILPGSDWSFFPRIGGDVLVLTNGTGLWAWNLATQKTGQILPYSEQGIHSDTFDADGERFVAALYLMGSPYNEPPGLDLFWSPLPSETLEAS